MPIPWKNLSGKANSLSFWTPLMILMKNVWHKTKTMITVSKRFYRRKSSEKNCLRKNNQYRYRSICYFRDRGNLCLRMWSRFIVVLIAIQVIVFWKKVSCYQRSKRSSGLNKLVQYYGVSKVQPLSICSLWSLVKFRTSLYFFNRDGEGEEFFFMGKISWEKYLTSYRAPGEPEGF